jgi:hypothetical protein
VSKESRRAAKGAARAGGPSTGAGQTPSSSGPSGTPRAGRRERARRYEQRSFVERYRGLLIGVVVVAVALVAGSVLFVGATQASYTCSIEWEASPTASPAAGATARLGYIQDPMGAAHNVGRPQKYLFCPPASGNHLNAVGQGPITPRVFKPTDSVGPPNWIHNLEHGGLVILYRGDSEGATAAGLDRFQQFFDTFPPGPICETPPHQLSPVVARFDQMKWPYAALVWGRVLPMEEWDPALALQFYATEAVRLDSEGQYVAPPEPGLAGCPQASQSAAPLESLPVPSPAASPEPSPAAS